MTKLYLTAKFSIILVLICIIPAFISLGFWQLNRAQYKMDILAKINLQSNLPAQPISNFLKYDYTQNRFTKVQVKGTPLNDRNILLDNQFKNKLAGYKIITPIKLSENPNIIVLLNRGFIALTQSRQKLPNIAPLANPLTITGIINNPATGLLLKKENYSDNLKWPLLRQNINFSQLERLLGNNLCSFVVQLENIDTTNFVKDIHKHKSYAFQWFTFATLGIFYCLYVVKNTVLNSS